ncbi:MAG: NADH:ubiquinone oxidoreductase subunit NDUFA12 [Alphaproteobacteria bacterium]|nr:NADH:ubiquinone oxidoreductase subunit NDUFA12 [Alphaproteobacteria bacterium]
MASVGTLISTIFFGRSVGKDEFGNRYFRERWPGRARPERRWVLYVREDEASNIPPGWHAWLHHSRRDPPTLRPLPAKQAWEKPHQPNLTGTPLAYRPPGHTLKGGKRAPATGDYEPWKPE